MTADRLLCHGPKRYNGMHVDTPRHCKACGHHHCRFCPACIRCGCTLRKGGKTDAASREVSK